ncbi:MAG: competence/damage-inducible protein A [Flavobacteriales bacterium]|jgi:nicotinamide-nucleotide amidase
MQAEIISIGDEILIGQTINTNAAWMGEHLNTIGIRVNRTTAIADSKEEIVSMISEALSRSQLVLITGGLGPTKDDITKKTLAEYFNMPLVRDEQTLERVSAFFHQRGLPVLPVNEDQALMPKGCTILHNLRGTANGMWFEKDGKVVVSMPGVPYEMEWLMENEVFPRVMQFFKRPSIVHRTVLTTGVGESFLADKISAWEDSLEEQHIKLAYLPSPGAVKLRMSAYGGGSEEELRGIIHQKENELLSIIGKHVYGFEKDTLASVVGQYLKETNSTIAVAESCTGGMISHLITEIPGSSAYFLGGLITYNEKIKIAELGVSAEIIAKHTVYSEEVALAMAACSVKTFGADYAISTTGVAGPNDSDGVTVGTIWVAAASREKAVCTKLRLGKSRERNIIMASNAALNLLRKEFLQINR